MALSGKISRRHFLTSAAFFSSGSATLKHGNLFSALQQPLIIRLSNFLNSDQADAILAGRYSMGMVEAFRLALGAVNLSGGTLRLPSGRILLDSAELGGVGLQIGPNVHLEGSTTTSTTIAIIGDTLCRLFRMKNASGAKISNLSLIGNNRSIGETVGAAIDCRFTETFAENALTLKQLSLDNFAAPGWIHIIADESSHVANLSISDVKVTSRAGNSRAPDDISENSAAIRVDAFAGKISSLVMRNVTVDATYIKSGIALYGAISGASLLNCSIDYAGAKGAEDDSGAYAIQVYSAGRDMRDIVIANALIRNPRSCGIYCTLADNVLISDAVISGQSDLKDDTLPKAAIALNGTRNVSIIGGDLKNNAVAIAFTPPRSSSQPLSLDLKNVSVSAASKAAFYARTQDEKSPQIFVKFSNCMIKSDGAGIAVRNNILSAIDLITIEQCCISAAGRAIDIYQDSPSGKSQLNIEQSSVYGGVSSLRARDADVAITAKNSRFVAAEGRDNFEVQGIGALRLENVDLTKRLPITLSQQKNIGRVSFSNLRVTQIPQSSRKSCDRPLM